MEPGHWIIITLVVAWAVVMLGAMWQANQRALLRHRERLAAIDKGLPLPPEPATRSPWRALQGLSSADDLDADRGLLEFIRFVGILIIAVGIGLYFLLTILGEWNAGVGFGGLTVIVGAAVLLTTARALKRSRGRDPRN